MIHIIVGTKAQMVKVAPLMLELQSRNIDYNFIFTGQHQQTMDQIRSNFSVKEPDITLHRGKDVSSIPSMLFWITKILAKTIFSRKTIFRGDRKGIVLVHGDTFSTLLGALMGKVSRLKVAHIESGLRSHNLFHPFPEEITRLITFRLSDIFLCPGTWAANNLVKMSGTIVNTEFNTLLDSLRAAKERFHNIPIDIPEQKYCICTTHRFENIFNKEIFERNIKLVEKTAKKMKVLFILHPVTERKLKDFGMYDRLFSNPNIEARPRYDYFEFMKLVYHSEFVISDGGSNQEECYYLGKPCILLRKHTERQEGIGQNVIVSEYKESVFSNFLETYLNLKGNFIRSEVSPVKIIVEHIEAYR